MHFSRQLAVFIKAGIPILDALEIISEETTDKLFKKALIGITEALQAGDTFAGAAGAHPEAFPRFYVGILESAELTGNLDVVLEQLAEYIERDLEARRKVTSALTYPIVVMVMAVITVIILTAFVLPKFKTFFKSLHAKLPLPTRMLLAVADFVSSWWFVLGGGAILTEKVFDLHGVGWYAALSLDSFDLPPIMGVTLYGAAFIVLFSVLVDLFYAFLDPRIRPT